MSEMARKEEKQGSPPTVAGRSGDECQADVCAAAGDGLGNHRSGAAGR